MAHSGHLRETSSDLSPELLKEQKDLDDAYAAFEDKARTFAQSKTFQRAKGGAPGFYPFGKGKGKKGKPKGNLGKGKGYGGWKGSSSPTSTSTTMGKPSNVLVTESVLAVNGYTGCFICGDRNHGFRQSSGKGKNVFWNTTVPSAMNGRIYMITEHEEQKVFVGGTDMMMDDPERPGGVVRETAGFGVLDIGATETVGSLEAIEKLCQLRGPHHAKEIKVIPHGQKSFRFGNNQVQRSESYIVVPQQIGQQWLQLGIFTLDVGQIPILIGVKTLTKLGAILDVAGQWMVLSRVCPGLKVPLRRSAAGHLLVDLTNDWMVSGKPLPDVQTPEPVLHLTDPTETAYMVHGRVKV